MSCLICTNSAIQASQLCIGPKRLLKQSEWVFVWSVSQRDYSQPHLKALICAVKQLSKGPLVGLFLRAVTANQRMSALPSAVVAKMGGQTPRGEFSVWQLLVKHPSKAGFPLVNLTAWCVLWRSQKRRLRELEVWSLWGIVSPRRDQKKTPPLWKKKRVRTTCQGRRFVCQHSTYGNTSADFCQSNFWVEARKSALTEFAYKLSVKPVWCKGLSQHDGRDISYRLRLL